MALWVVAVVFLVFQSALRFAVVADLIVDFSNGTARFQSALRFAVVADPTL